MLYLDGYNSASLFLMPNELQSVEEDIR